MNNRLHNRQTGAALLFALVILLLVTLLSLNAMRSSWLDQLFAGNSQWQTTALATAETGLTSGETIISQNYNGVPDFNWSTDTTDGLYYYGDVTDIRTIWSGTTSHNTGNDGSLYAIEYLGPYPVKGTSLAMGAGTSPNRRFLYRVTGMSSGTRGAERLVQSIYATTE